MAYLDFKVTSWKRVYIPDHMVGVVQDKLAGGDLDTPYDLLEEPGYYELVMGPDEMCEEPISVEENGGDLTQEIFTDEGDSIWMNVKN